jgi:hypothetical protein
LSTPFIPPNPVGTAYQKPKPKEEMDMEEREKFWNEVNFEVSKKINGILLH